MVDKILTASGVKYRRGRYMGKPPATYAVYTDDIETRGPDGKPSGLIRHEATVELYMSKPDQAAMESIEAAIADAGLQYERQDLYWIQAEQLYQVVYDFTYYEKRRA